MRTVQGGQQYLDVKYRLVWLRDKEVGKPGWGISTKLIYQGMLVKGAKGSSDWSAAKIEKLSRPGVIFYTEITDETGRVIGSGHGSETADDFAEWIEKGECVPLDSQILTRQGFKYHDEVNVGEEVLAYDKDTDQCRWTPLRAITVHSSLPMARLHNTRDFTVDCTPNHSWAVLAQRSVDMERVWSNELREAQNITKNCKLIISAPGAAGGDSPITPDEAAMIGWIFTDGTIQRRGAYTRAAITQSKPETVGVLHALVGGITKEWVGLPTVQTFPSGKTYACLPQHIWSFSGPDTKNLFAKAGISNDSDLPALVTRLSEPARAAMLEAMMQADGDKRGYFGKKKPFVMETFQILGTLQGRAIGKELMSTAGDVPLHKLKKRRYVSGSELTLDAIDDQPAWCPTTDYGTWVMRQRGHIMITGNTKSVGRALAAAGFGTQFAAELDEEEDGTLNLADSPVEAPAPKRFTPNQDPLTHPSSSGTVENENKGSTVCADCGQPVTGYKAANGQIVSAETLLDKSMKLYQKPLCRTCYALAASKEVVKS